MAREEEEGNVCGSVRTCNLCVSAVQLQYKNLYSCNSIPNHVAKPALQGRLRNLVLAGNKKSTRTFYCACSLIMAVQSHFFTIPPIATANDVYRSYRALCVIAEYYWTRRRLRFPLCTTTTHLKVYILPSGHFRQFLPYCELLCMSEGVCVYPSASRNKGRSLHCTHT